MIQVLVLGIVTTHLLLEQDPHLAAENQFYLLSVSILLPRRVCGHEIRCARGPADDAVGVAAVAPEICHRLETMPGSSSSSRSCS